MIEIIGWISNLLFTSCGIPDLYNAVRYKRPPGMTWLYLFLLTSAEVLSLVYLGVRDYTDNVVHYPLTINYFLSLIMVISLMVFKKKYQ